jgi:hypothetical protein
MAEAVLQIAVVVLVRLRLHDNRVRQADSLDQPDMIFQGISGRLVGRIRRIREAPWIKKVNVRLDRSHRRSGE